MIYAYAAMFVISYSALLVGAIYLVIDMFLQLKKKEYEWKYTVAMEAVGIGLFVAMTISMILGLFL